MKKTAALRLAKQTIPHPVCFEPPHYIVRVPVDLCDPTGERMDIRAGSFIEAQHARAFAICRVALVHMGLAHVPLTPQDGATVEQLMNKALHRAMNGSTENSPLPFWRVQLGAGSQDCN